MAQMGFAIAAMDFGAFHKETAIRSGANRSIVARGPKAGPAGAAFVFLGLIKQRSVTAYTVERAGCFGEIIMGMRTFRAMGAGHFIGQGR